MVFRKKKSKDDEDPFEGRRPFGGDEPFGEFFIEMDKIEEIMNELMRGMFSGEVRINKPFVYGFSVKSGPDGKPVVQEFGNVNKEKAPHVEDAREPLVDIIDGGTNIIVIAELPGVDKTDIQLEARSESLEIKVDTPNKKFYKSIQLPDEVEEDATDASYNNGVLEVKLKKKESESKGKRIKIR